MHKSNVQIPNYKLKWKGQPKVESKNKSYKRHDLPQTNRTHPALRNDWYPGSKLDTFNVYYKPFEKSKWKSESKLQDSKEYLFKSNRSIVIN